MNLYVSNLAPDTTRDELLQAFQAHGEVSSVSLPGERMKDGQPAGVHRGFAFVEMRDRVQARAAVKAIEGKPLHGKALSVRQARARWTPTYVS